MTTSDRRTFLRVLGGTALAATLPESIGRAMAIPANHRTGTIEDVEHIVVLMQENRSFDHYFGSLRGVRGFEDPRAVRLASGQSVWHQPDGAATILPFRPTAPDLGLQFIEDLAHDWSSTHAAFNHGNYDQWVPAKGATTMAYLTRQDIPFHYALADAFTICDAYHCSLMGPTDPNRYYMWTGWVGNDGSGGGPVVDNAEAGYGWSTYPEVLTKAGISWRVYQDVGNGLDAAGSWGWTGDDPYIGNYGDNSLLYFHQYQNALPGSALYQGARVGTDISAGGTLFDQLRQDVRQNKLPQVSYIVAPEAYSEHPNWPANYGAWYVSQVLDALTANPEVWSKTALFITFDENDGFFDHMVPPYAPASAAEGLSTVATTNEIFPGNATYPAGPYGLGPRVPMIVVSPWSKGGWVSSQVFDHTSIIRFVERRFGSGRDGLPEANVTPWRRTVCGDLTSAFDFANPNGAPAPLPSTAAYVPPDAVRHPDYVPVPPADQSVPPQEDGLRRARALPYELDAHGQVDLATARVQIRFTNSGAAGACFQVRSADASVAPRSYTVEAGKAISDAWAIGTGGYDLSVYGPNGFFRRFKGSVSGRTPSIIEVGSSYDAAGCGHGLVLANRGHAACRVILTNAYTGQDFAQVLTPGESVGRYWPLAGSFGWYDFTVRVAGDEGFLRHLAGHVETGRDSVSDPAIGADRRRHRPGI
ncbi:MAG TPA: phospholipase C, phosphocholine-specific [Aliidongia sp.]|uniref:phosphocholine-specific phospholipase C n=1 Tax=Aliidongia sp. TaxID=1914230 RepID=UPI002DDCFD94|nr:phospholipase C, phosphocholine-specific [Aliidongia sp.]HEV2678224.1 phospholipase C, phosphocholine-specific [Aliidongia sp.]